jgi:transposase-like protein
LPALLIIIYGRNSPVAAWLGRFSGGRKKNESDELEDTEPGLDRSYWTSERKIALVKEIMSGRASAAAAAREYALPEAEVEKWMVAAETGINDALSGITGGTAADREKFRVLAKAYKKVKAENRALKASQGK